jgi:aspartate ammonia-lyase
MNKAIEHKEPTYRLESDLLGELQIPADAYYGVQTQRGINNYKISTVKRYDYPDFIIAFAYVKKAAALANAEAGALDSHIAQAIAAAADEVIAGQLQLNVMEPVITECIFESITWLAHAMDTLREKCVSGITVNEKHNLDMVRNSIGIVTALNPYIGYKNSTKIAKEALETGKSLEQIALEKGLLTKEQLDEILDPKAMLQVHKLFS